MKCDLCHINEATIHLVKIQGNKVERINLCKECAKKFSFLSDDDFYEDLAGILYKLFSEGSDDFANKRDKKAWKNLRYSKNRKCPYCGIDLETIKKSGKVGCSNCYSEFKRELYPVIMSIQGSLENKSKVPVNTTRKIKLEKSLRDLKNKLQNEIIIENFEEAARIRDRIKKLERNKYGG
jgi:protein arginine kinase activator